MLTDGTIPPPHRPALLRRGERERIDGGGFASGRSARNETDTCGRKKKKRVGERERNQRHGASRHPAPASETTARREAGRADARGGPHRAPRGGSRHHHNSRPQPRETAAAGAGGRRVLRWGRGKEPAEEEPGSPPGPTDPLFPPTYGPHRPPDPGDGRATPPGVFKPPRRNARARYPGQERGRTRDAQKAGAHGERRPATPRRPTPPATRPPLRRLKSQSRGGERVRPRGEPARRDHRPGKRTRTAPSQSVVLPDGKEAEAHGGGPRWACARPPAGVSFARVERGGGKLSGGGPRAGPGPTTPSFPTEPIRDDDPGRARVHRPVPRDPPGLASRRDARQECRRRDGARKSGLGTPPSPRAVVAVVR